MYGRSSMLLCAKATFLTSLQMEKLCRSEVAWMAALSCVKSSKTSELRARTYVESPGECSTLEAFSLLRCRPRRF